MKNNTKKTLRIYWQHLTKYKPSFSVTILAVIAASVFSVIIPLYFKDFFDVLSNGNPDRSASVSALISILITILILESIQWVAWRIATFTSSYFYAKVMADLSNNCFAYLHKHSFTFFNNNFVGSLVKRVKWFVSAFEDILDKITWNTLPLVVNITVIFIVLYQRNIYLGLGILTWVVIFLVINWFFTKYKLRYDIQRSETETRSTGLLADTVTNNSNVKLFNGYQREVTGFAAVTEELRKIRRLTWDLSNFFEAVQGFLMVVLEIGIFYLAIKLWQKGVLTVGDFVLIQAYVLNIIMRVWDFGRVIQHIYERLADAEEMTQILNTPHEIQDIPGAKDLEVAKGKIEFKKVSFFYHQTRKIFSDFDLVVKPGERLALVGPSGAGKTTIIKLLLRMHDLSGGQILVDGQDIAKVRQESLWQNISLVPQDPILFHRTLLENIRYGKAGSSDVEVMVAAKAAHCHEFIGNLADGYNTYVGERGIKLSGGERQRVAIARAILRNAPILVLDEATSSLDSHSESLIQDALDNLMKGKTVIVIAHRLSTIRKMDRIIVIDEGGINEEGCHDELIKKDKGIYQKLWHLQAGGFIQ
ncbi:MAG: ABC transporter ATP-binding protein [Patescibacteria group bacterium]